MEKTSGNYSIAMGVIGRVNRIMFTNYKQFSLHLSVIEKLFTLTTILFILSTTFKHIIGV